MARWVMTTVTLNAAQAAGTDPILAAASGAAGTSSRRLLAVGSRSVSATELFLATGGVAGNGLPLAAGARLDFSGDWPPFDGGLYILGAAEGEKVVLLTA